MYICLDCGHIFDEPKEWVETHGFDYGPYEEWSGCPRCGGAYEKAVECDICGEYYRKSELTDGLCDNCYEEEEEDYND